MAISGGKYATEVDAGRVFIGSTAAAGTALPISTGTAVTFGVWNTSQNKRAIPLWLKGGYTSGTIALGTLGFGIQNCGYATATGAPLTAFNDASGVLIPRNAKKGAGGTAMRFCPAGTTTLTSGSLTEYFWLSSSIESATAGTGIFRINEDFDGCPFLMPGELGFVCCSVAQTALFSLSMAWAEVEF